MSKWHLPPLDERVDSNRPVADAAADSAWLRRARTRAAVLGVVLLTAAGILTVSVAADPVNPWFQPFDDRWLGLMEHIRTPVLTRLAEFLSVVGSGLVTWPVRAVAVVLLVQRRRWTQLTAFLVAIVFAELLTGPLKVLIDRPRPPRAMVDTTLASFPSGHAIAAAVTSFGLVVALLPRGRRRLWWTVLATTIASSMAWSRTYLAAHWATDTIAGVCFGVGAAVLSEVVFESTRTRVAQAVGTSGPPGQHC